MSGVANPARTRTGHLAQRTCHAIARNEHSCARYGVFMNYQGRSKRALCPSRHEAPGYALTSGHLNLFPFDCAVFPGSRRSRECRRTPSSCAQRTHECSYLAIAWHARWVAVTCQTVTVPRPFSPRSDVWRCDPSSLGSTGAPQSVFLPCFSVRPYRATGQMPSSLPSHIS